MAFGHRRAQRRGMVMGAALASSRARKQAAAAAVPAPATTEPAPATDPTVEQLKQLTALRDQGILTEEEFSAKKKQLLGL